MAEENKDKNEFGKKVVEEAKKLLGLKYNAQGGDGKTDINEGNFIYTVFNIIPTYLQLSEFFLKKMT